MDYSYLDFNHLDSVLEIERESNPYPWTARNFSDCIEKCYYSMVLEDKEKFVGFAIMAISSEESHLLNIGVNKDFRGSGFGEQILKKMIIAAEVMGSKKSQNFMIKPIGHLNIVRKALRAQNCLMLLRYVML